jgi:hypothetical protein
MQDTGFVKQQEKEQELLVCFSVLCRVYYVCDTGWLSWNFWVWFIAFLDVVFCFG